MKKLCKRSWSVVGFPNPLPKASEAGNLTSWIVAVTFLLSTSSILKSMQKSCVWIRWYLFWQTTHYARKLFQKSCSASKVSCVHFLGILVDQIVKELNVLYHPSSPHLWQRELVACCLWIFPVPQRVTLRWTFGSLNRVQNILVIPTPNHHLTTFITLPGCLRMDPYSFGFNPLSSPEPFSSPDPFFSPEPLSSPDPSLLLLFKLSSLLLSFLDLLFSLLAFSYLSLSSTISNSVDSSWPLLQESLNKKQMLYSKHQPKINTKNSSQSPKIGWDMQGLGMVSYLE